LVEEGSLYPALQRLRQKGFVKADWRTSDTGRRARYYQLTRQGRERLAAEVAGYKRVNKAIGRMLAQEGV
jgi:DNA-binding PadR family transcriptional regulator